MNIICNVVPISLQVTTLKINNVSTVNTTKYKQHDKKNKQIVAITA